MNIFVRMPFPFTDLSGHKVRPAVVLYTENKGEDFIVCFISSKGKARSCDVKVRANTSNGLKVDSIIKTSKIATLEKRLALGEIGILDKKTIKELNNVLGDLKEARKQNQELIAQKKGMGRSPGNPNPNLV